MVNTLVCQANFCQGHSVFPVLSRGKQCMSNCLVFVLLCYVKPASNLNTNDLDSILHIGDVLYRKVLEKQSPSNTNEFLLYADLPAYVSLNDFNFKQQLTHWMYECKLY